MQPLFLALDEVLEIHAQQMELYGGSDGVRDPAGLESTFGGDFLHSTIPSMAAAYLFHICQNHPFVDGNKRTAVSAALTFLDMNGIEVDADEDAFYDLVLGVAEGRVSKASVTVFLEEHAA